MACFRAAVQAGRLASIALEMSQQRDVKSRRNDNIKPYPVMKKLNKITLLVALVAGLSTFTGVRADDKPANPGGPGKPPADQGKPEGAPGKPADIGVRVPDRFKDDAKLQELIAAAKVQREAFVAKQKDIAAALKGSTADQKEKIKEQLKANREQFLADTKQLRTDIRDRVKELVGELKAGNVKGAGTEGAGHGRRGGN